MNEGWQLLPGAPPTAIYHLVREKPGSTVGGSLRLGIDDEKIVVLRNGQVVG